MSRTTLTTSISLPRGARIFIATAIMALMSMTNIHPSAQDKSTQDESSKAKNRLSHVKPGRSVVRSQHAMVATSQPLASQVGLDRKSTRLNSSHLVISYAVFCLKKKNKKNKHTNQKT